MVRHWWNRNQDNTPRPTGKNHGRLAARKPLPFRPTLEILEERVVLTTVFWNVNANGFWDVGSNWSTGAVPGANDDVVIDRPAGNFTVTHRSGEHAVRSIQSAEALRLTGGTLTVTDTVAVSGAFTLAGGTLSGGTVVAGTTLTATNSGGALDGVVLEGNFNLNNSAVQVLNGLTVNGTVNLNGGANLQLPSSQTLGGSGAVVFGSSSTGVYLSAAETTLTIGPNLTLRGANGAIGFFPGRTELVTVINQGTIQAEGGTLNVTAQTITNQGTLTAASGATLVVTAQATTGDPTVVNQGTLAAASDATLVVSGLTGDLGTTSIAAGATLSLDGTYTVNQPVSITDATLTLGGDWSSTAAITASGSTVTFEGTYTLGQPVSVVDSTLTLNGAWANASTITATDSTVNLGGDFTLEDLGTFQSTGGAVNLTGTLHNTGTLALTGSSWRVLGGTIIGGTVTTANGAALLATDQGGTLDGVTLGDANNNGDLTASGGGWLTVTNDLTLHGTVTLGDASDDASWGRLDFVGTPDMNGISQGGISASFGSSIGPHPSGSGQISIGGRFESSVFSHLVGSGQVVFGASAANALRPTTGAAWLVIDQGILLHGQSGSIGYSAAHGGPTDVAVEIQGTIQADVGGGILRTAGERVLNNGRVAASNGGALYLGGLADTPGDFSIGLGTALALDGTYTIEAGRVINLTSASLTLNGFWDNAGTIKATNSSINLGGLNTHLITTLVVNPPSGLRLTAPGSLGTFEGTGNTVNLAGTLDLTFSNLTLSAAFASWHLLGGTIYGGRVITADGGVLVATPSGGTLSGTVIDRDVGLLITGANRVTVSNVSVYDAELSGLTVNGSVTLGDATDTDSWGALDLTGNQVLKGSGQIVFGASPFNAIRLTEAGTELQIQDLAMRGQSGVIGYAAAHGGPDNVNVINRGVIVADVAGGTLQITGTSFGNGGKIGAANGGTLDIEAPATRIGAINSTITGTVRIAGNITGYPFYSDFKPLGTTVLDGNGTAATPQLLEAPSADRGNGPDAFGINLAFDTLALANDTYVRLVDLVDDQISGILPEVVYVNTLIVPAGCTLDLTSPAHPNGLKFYARVAQIAGTVIGAITLVPDAGAIAPGTSAPGEIGAAGEVDEWRFSGRGIRAVTIILNPGTSTEPAPLPPALDWADIRLLDSAGHVLAQASNVQPGEVLTLADVPLPDEGTYSIQIRAAASNADSTGRYLLQLWDATPKYPLWHLNEPVTSRITSPFAVDRYEFPASANQVIQLDVLGAAAGIQFRLRAPDGSLIFNNQATDTGLITLPQAGQYTLTVHAGTGQTGDYAFRLLSSSATDLTVGTPYRVPADDEIPSPVASGQFRLFRVQIATATPLIFNLEAAPGNRNELYVSMGAPPTRASASYQSLTPGSDQSVLVPLAAPGTWYVLVYSEVASTGTFQITAQAGPLLLGQVSPDTAGDAADTILTVTGAGFVPGTTVELVASGGTVHAGTVQVHATERLTARFAAGTVPEGSYTLRIRRPDGSTAERANAFTMVAGGEARLITRLILPEALARHGLGELFVEYTNAGTVAMPAPVLVVHASDRGFMTLDRSILTGGFGTEEIPDGFSDTVQILASGATAGLLQPGETFRVPIYWAGVQFPPEPSPIDFELFVSTEGQTELIDWVSLNEFLRPAHIPAEAWAPVFANLIVQVGTTWGDYIHMLNDNAAYLARLGQRVVDVRELFAFEVMQAYGFHPVTTLTASADATVEAPGLSLTFGRAYTNSILGHYDLGILGRGWHTFWEERLVLEASGVVALQGPGGRQRRFEPDRSYLAASSVFISDPGDHGILTRLAGGSFALREADGLLRQFHADGLLDFIEDLNSNRITAGYTGGLLTSLTHSAGQSLALSYNAFGRVESITDSEAETTHFTYDATGEHLLSVEYPDARTMAYTYNSGAGAAHEHALTSIRDAANVVRTFTYDTAGRLGATFLTGNTERFDFTFDTAGTVTITDAVGTSRVFVDQRGLIVRYVDALGHVSSQTFDEQYNLTRFTDALGFFVDLRYDAHGNVTRMTDPLGQVTEFTYSHVVNGVPAERLTSLTDARRNTMSFGYDNRGNQTTTMYPNQLIEAIVYAANGDVQSLTNRRGQVISFTYNAAGQVLRKTYADGSFIDATYDARGNLETLTDESGVINFTYDLGDRLTRIAYPSGRALDYTYDDAGRRERMVDQDGFTVNYQYDSAGRLAGLTDGDDNMIVSYSYDGTGRLVGVVRPAQEGIISSTWDALLHSGSSEGFGSAQASAGTEHVLDLGGAQLEVTAFSWTQTNATNAGTAQAGAFVVTAAASAASPALAVAVAAGTVLPQVVLTSRNAAGQVYARWVLHDVTVESYHATDAATDELSFRFGSLEQTVTTYAANGTPNGELSAGYDFIAHQSIHGDVPVVGSAVGTPPQSLEVDGGGLIAAFAIEWSAAGLADVHVDVPMSLASPGLLQAAATGQRFGEVVLISRELVAGQLREVSRWTLQGVRVTSYQSAASVLAGLPMDSFTLRFDRISLTRTTLASDGTTLGTNTASWNRLTAQVTGAGVFGSAQASAGTEHVLDLGGAQLEVTAFSWTQTNEGTAQAGAFLMTAAASAASPALAVAVAAGTMLPQVVLSSRNAAGQVYARWVLHDVTVASYHATDAATDADEPTDELSFRFASLEQTVTTYAANGTLDRELSAGYDFVAHQSIHGDVLVVGSAVGTPPQSLEVDGGGLIAASAIEWSAAGLADVHVDVPMSLASPGLLQAAATGQRFGEVVLISRELVAGQLREVSRWTLQGVRVTSYQSAASVLAGLPMDSFTLRFDRISLTRTTLASDGTTLGTNTSSWNRLTAQVTGAGAFGSAQASAGTEHVLDLGSAQLEVTAFSWTQTNEGTAQAGAFTVTAAASAASPALAVAVAAGTMLPQVVLSSRNAAGQVYARWVLHDVTVASYHATDAATDELSFRFASLELTHTNSAGERTVGYDFANHLVTVGSDDLDGNAGSMPEYALTVDGDPITVSSFEWLESTNALGEVSVTASMSLASPGLLLAVATGRVYDQIDLASYEVREGQRREFARWKLEEVTVTSYQSSAQLGSDGLPGDTFALHFNRITLTRTGPGSAALTTTYEYDAAGQLLHLSNRGPDGSIHSRFDYTYDAAGRRITMSTLDGNWTYEYDALGQLTHAFFDSANVAAIPDQDLRYTYDAVGNRVQTIINGVTTAYITNNLNQYVQVGDATYRYDLDGNLVSITTPNETTTFTYDDDSRLIGVTTPDQTWNYEYNALGDRSASVVGGVRTEYLVDPLGLGDVVGEYSGGTSTQYVHGFGLVSRFSAGSMANYEFDGLGSVVGLASASGSMLNRYVYAPFGEKVLSQETVANPFQFVGQFGVMHESNGLEFMRTRLFNSQAGRFIQVDSISLAGGLNLYRYAVNNPISFIDPSGQSPVPLLPDVIDQIDVDTETGEYLIVGWDRDGNVIVNQGKIDQTTDLDHRFEFDPETGHSRETMEDERRSEPNGGGSSPPGSSPPSNRRRRRPDLGPSHHFDPFNDIDPPVPPGQLTLDPPSTDSAVSQDPNQKLGSAGFGEPNFVAADAALPYRIDFENDAAAPVPAQRVDIVDQLDDRFDWDTFEFTGAGFGKTFLTVPQGSRYYRTTVAATINDRDVEVDIELRFDALTGRILASIRTLDPKTSLPPLDVFTGFLPPEDGSGRGQGFFSYLVRADAGLPTGTALRNVARIQFDFGEIIDTNQVEPHDPSQGTDPNKEVLITLDAGAPTSSVQALPASSPINFTVNWAGEDDASGSGIAFYDVHVAADGGAFTLWQNATLATSAVYPGAAGHTYRFYSVATDHVGHRQDTPTADLIQSTTVTAFTLDVDDDGAAQALTDGLVILRYLFGFTGNALVQAAVNPAGSRTSAESVRAYLEQGLSYLDVDQSGSAEALTDGLLVLRFLFGFSGTALIQDAVSPAGTRTDSASIHDYLAGLLPVEPLVEPSSASLMVVNGAAQPEQTSEQSEEGSAHLPRDAPAVQPEETLEATAELNSSSLEVTTSFSSVSELPAFTVSEGHPAVVTWQLLTQPPQPEDDLGVGSVPADSSVSASGSAFSNSLPTEAGSEPWVLQPTSSAEPPPDAVDAVFVDGVELLDLEWVRG